MWSYAEEEPLGGIIQILKSKKNGRDRDDVAEPKTVEPCDRKDPA